MSTNSNHLVSKALSKGFKGISIATVIMARFEDIDPETIGENDPLWNSIERVLALDGRRKR
jgi:hypothetical protein